MKKNIWILNHYAHEMFFAKGGRHYSLAKYLKRAGCSPVIFCANAKHSEPGHYFEDDALWHEHLAEEIGVPYVFIKTRAYSGNGKQRVLNMVDFFFHVKKAAAEYAKKNGKPDVIYASSVHPLTLVAGIQLAKKFGVRCICEVRDLWPESIVEYSTRLSRDNPVVKLLYLGEKWIYKKADKLIFTMEGGYDYIVERGWEHAIPKSKVFHVNNGVDLEVFDNNRDTYRIQDDDLEEADNFKVVYTGSIRTVNNLGLLLDAAKQIQNPKIRILVWGDGDELPQLRERVQTEEITNVVFKGRVQKKYVPYIVSRADMNIAHNMPSPLFRFGISFNKMFDYLAAGKPILSDFPCPYNPAVIMGASMQTDEPSPENIADTIETIAQLDSDAYRQCCDCARSAAQVYDYRNQASKLLDIIKQ